ncbi:hypothetical protein Fmac_001779 [Flemingia macrophylla]|uniref:Disease resistance protein At4g27190-like leucine-rich repeats domain-containing protein n=1 Tax=Flemingia macrophylla TaxID=520843 RepID=A0ABD1NI34_9FABA
MFAEGGTNETWISFLSKLTHLNQLKVVDLSIPCIADLPKDLFFDKLNDYKIVIGDLKVLSVGDFKKNKHEESRSLALHINEGNNVETPNLESLNLSLLNIHKIWSDQLQPSFHFQNLINLVVKDCKKLRYLCSLSVANGLRNLKSLLVSGCRMMEKLFTYEENIVHKVWVFPKLEEIHLSEMSSLIEIWPVELSADSFSGLVFVYIERCERLDKIFPCHLEGWFATLDKLTVIDCISVKVIFEIQDSQQIDAYDGIDTNLQFIVVDKLPNLKQVWSINPEGILNFKKLKSIVLSKCGKLLNVFPASMAKELQKLQLIDIGRCDAMVEIFAFEDVSKENSEPLVFPELKKIILYRLANMKHFYKGRHPIVCPKLKGLLVFICPKLKIFPTENANEEEKSVLSAEKKWLLSNIDIYQMNRIKDLALHSVKSGELIRQLLYGMSNLEKLYVIDNDSEHLLIESSDLGTVSQLKELYLRDTNIKDLGFQGDPILQRLEALTIYNCHQLSNFAPPSISLCYLTYLEVTLCANLKNLMASSTAQSLVQLKTMKVIQCDLKEIVTNEENEDDNIEIVFSSLITIQLVTLKYLTRFCSYKNCKFTFPSLEILIVRECPMMKTFSESNPIAPKLQNILTIEGKEEDKWEWEENLNATIQKGFNDKVTFPNATVMNLSYYPQYIKQLWHLNHSVQQNYFHNLKRLTAKGCDTLVHVIPSHLIPCFQNLEVLEVWNCSKAQLIFNINEIKKTKSLGITRLKTLNLSDLPELQHVLNKGPEGIIDLRVLENMRVENCGCLKSLFPETVAKDLKCRLEVLKVSKCKALVEIFSKDEKGTEEATKEFVFGCLTSLSLKELPELKYFYPGSHTLEWPVLEELYANDCVLVKLACQEDQVLIQIGEPQVKLIQIPSLKALCFCIGDTSVEWNRESGKLSFAYLKDFREESNCALLYRFLCLLPIIEKLSFNKCLFEDMLSKERPNDGYTRIMFDKMDNLKSIGLEHSWLQPLEAPFSNLTCLEVSSCKRVLYLFTSSIAKSLVQLKTVNIQECESLKEIVSTEGDESREDEHIKFEQLEVLHLEGLHQLRCFYYGNCTLHFPCLERVYIIDCSFMFTFSPKNILDHSIKWFTTNYGTPKRENDLNSAVGRRFEEKILEPARSGSGFGSEGSPLQKIWLDTLPISRLCFSNLDCLIVVGPHFSSDVVLPLNLLHLFAKLGTLEVRKCDSVKTIFDVKCITQDTQMTTIILAPIPLKKLTLSELPNLENVWNEDPQRILRMQLLKNVYVEKCESLTSVFPASVAKDLEQLENLVVQNCKELMAIVAEEKNANPNVTDVDLTFPCMVSLTLCDLPKFTHLEQHIENQVCIEKLTPNLQHLILGKNELKTIWHEDFQGNLLHKLKDIIFLNFDVESKSLSYEFLQQIPTMEKLEVSYCSAKEIFCCQSPNSVHDIGFGNTWIESFLKTLETLDVSSCSHLRNLALSPVCFSKLTCLFVIECHGLENLFTVSIAKSLAWLKIMEIKNCESIEEIVTKKEDGSNEDEIIFWKLLYLNLESLPNLICFYMGSLSFPSLVQLSVINCPKMETLCAGDINADKIFEIKFQNNSDAMFMPLRIDLNSTIRMVTVPDAFSAFHYLSSETSDTNEGGEYVILCQAHMSNSILQVSKETDGME